MKNIKKLSFIVIVTLVLAGGFASSVPKVLAATGGGTATIAKDGGAQGAGVTVVQSTSHIFTTVLTINSSGMTLGAASPTFTIPTGFTAPTLHAVATTNDVDADGKWSVVAAAGSGTGGCTVSSDPASSITVASGQVITVDITADCAFNNIITLTYKGTSAVAMGATALTVSTADAGDPGPVHALLAGSPTITVTAAAATLTLVKTITNDNGGTRPLADFQLTATGTTTITGVSGTGPVTGATVTAGTYTLSEITHSDYTAGLWTCTNGIVVTSSQITLGSGQTTVCTINNNDIAPSLTLDKVVVNDNAGTALETAWTLTATGPTTLSGAGAAGSIDVVSGASFDQGTYTLSESTGLTGYTASSWSCTNGITVNGSSQITLGLGQSTVCTITDNDIAQAVSDEASVDIRVTKEASKTVLRSGPEKVTFTYKVTNRGDVTLSDVSVKDDTCDSVKYVSGDDNSNDLLDTDEEWKYTCKKTVRKTETNTVTAKGTANGEEVKDTDTAKVTVSVPGLPNVGAGPGDNRDTLQGFFIPALGLLGSFLVLSSSFVRNW
ncbi:MAG: hypothetical protein WAV46_04070 [Candidatus Moraniibacteriota bacterium]